MSRAVHFVHELILFQIRISFSLLRSLHLSRCTRCVKRGEKPETSLVTHKFLLSEEIRRREREKEERGGGERWGRERIY